MTDYSAVSLHQIHKILISRNIDIQSLKVEDIAEFLDEYRKPIQTVIDIQNIDYAIRNPRVKSKKSNRIGNRKSTFSAAQVQSTLINPH